MFPAQTTEAANNATLNLLPEKSRSLYDGFYQNSKNDICSLFILLVISCVLFQERFARSLVFLKSLATCLMKSLMLRNAILN